MGSKRHDAATKAAVRAALVAYDGNVKRTARETGVAVSTVRDWKQDWERNGFPENLNEVLEQVTEDVVEGFTRIRNKAALELERLIDDQQLKGRELVVAIGMLTDKIRLYKGEATSRTESKALVEPQQLRELVAGFFEGAVAAAQERAEEIEEADWEPAEVIALPAPQEVVNV
jgi:transposase-like protein